MARATSISKLQTGNADLDRVQEHLRQQLNPVLASLPSASDFRWVQLPGADQTVADSWALQFRTTGTTWTTIVSVTSAGQIVQPAWTAPTYVNGWADFGSGFMAGAYMKDSLGFVHLRGFVTNAAGTGAGNAIFVLPSGFRPSATIRQGVDSEAVGVPSRIDIDTSGNVKCPAASGAGAIRSLANITFDTRS